MSPTRRDVLKAGAGAAAASSFAGCLSAFGLGDDIDADGYTAFFAIHDFVEQVSGDQMDFENPVGTGRMGHGWNAPADLSADIAATDAFFYLDTPEFEWAQDVADTLERDEEDVELINLLNGLEPYLIGMDEDGDDEMPEPDYGHEYPEESLALDEIDIWDLRSQEQAGYWHVDHWHGFIPDVLVDRSVPIGIVVRDTDGRVVPLGDEYDYQVDARVVSGDEDAVDITVDENVVEFHGVEPGAADIAFEIRRGDELIDDTTDELTTVDVVEEHDGEAEEFHDPHTWVDPVIVQEMVQIIANELGELDPDNADTYEENAREYNDRIEDVHQQLEDTIDDAELDVAVFAGHDSYQYVERRYGFDLKTPVGISPDASVSPNDISGLIEVIEDNDIDTVLYDPFETTDDSYPEMVEVIFEEGIIEDAKPLTPVEGITEQWEENGWGWVEQMEEINIPALEQALNPD